MKDILVWFWVRRARVHYLRYQSMLDQSSAGASITSSLPSVSRQKERVNSILARIHRIDPGSYPLKTIKQPASLPVKGSRSLWRYTQRASKVARQ